MILEQVIIPEIVSSNNTFPVSSVNTFDWRNVFKAVLLLAVLGGGIYLLLRNRKQSERERLETNKVKKRPLSPDDPNTFPLYY